MTLASMGDNCVDRYVAPRTMEWIGGNALNVAVGLARMGHRTAYLGAVGDDPEGRAVMTATRAAGVETGMVETLPGETGITIVELTEAGDRVFLEEHHGVNATYRPDAEALEFLRGCAWVHAAGRGEHVHVLSQIEGTRLSYDFSQEDGSQLIELLAPRLEVAFFSGAGWERDQAMEVARSAVRAGARAAVVTRGRQGSLAWNGRLVERPAEPVAVVDTLGAGDALIAAVVSAQVEGAALDEALEAGGRAAALACTHFGAWEPA